MSADAIVNIVSGIGFPAACCVALFWSNYQQTKQHKSEMDKMSEAINNNTLVIQKLVDTMTR